MAMKNFLMQRRNLDWLILFALSALYLTSSISQWNVREESFPWDAPSMATLSGSIAVIVLLSFLFQRYGLQRTWTQVFRFTGPLDPKDEREWNIHSKATEYTFGFTYLLLLFVGIFLLQLPSPTSQALFYLLLSILFFLVALRGFLTWLFGIR